MTDSALNQLPNEGNLLVSQQYSKQEEQTKRTLSKKKHSKRHKNKPSKNPQKSKQSNMLKKAEKLIQSSDINFLFSLSNTPLGLIRKNYCYQILKCLLFSYQELNQQMRQKRVYGEELSIKAQSLLFFQKYGNLENSVLALVEITSQIQYEMFQLYGVRFGDEENQPRKYKFQMSHFLRNLKDIYNNRFRQEIITGILSPKNIACMDQLEMLQPNKKQYIITKKKSLLHHRKLFERHGRVVQKQEEERKQSQIIYNNELQPETIDFEMDSSNQIKLSVFFANNYVDRLESQIMETKNKSIRKRLLLNLQKELKL